MIFPIPELIKIADPLPRDLRLLCSPVLKDEAFALAPASETHHHACTRGLSEHTLEVVQLVREMAPDEESRDLLTVAAIWHDYAKIWEYEWKENKIVSLPYKNKIGHIVGSYLQFQKSAINLLSTYELMSWYPTLERIAHCILSHHGRREWGSPVEPQTLEAHILHSADMTSMQRAKAKQ